jgi:N-acetylmuramoyl-L-alanine amidase
MGTRFSLWLLVVLVLALGSPARRVAAQSADALYYPQTGYWVEDEAFRDYFRRRGGVRTFGYPVSNPFTLLGFRVQIFQRGILQQRADGSATTMNILDEGMMPYTRVNGSTFPAPDQEVIRRQPGVGTPDYHQKALAFVKDFAPDVWEGLNVNFYRTFAESVRLEDAFPDRRGNAGLLEGFNLEVWGLPTSRPTFDPANSGFVYLRFQRGIMHFDSATGTTQGLLLADYVKSILTLRNLPPDLAEQARRNPMYGQLDPEAPRWVSRPRDLPESDLTDAFLPDGTVAVQPRPGTPTPVEKVRGNPTVFVDPGHGGKELGASLPLGDGTTLLEKDFNLKVATRLAQILRESDVRPVLSRTNDARVNESRDLTDDGKVNLTDDLQARVDLANEARAQLIVSVHFNGVVDSSKRGTQVFYADGRPFSDRSRMLAELTQANLVKALRDVGYETLDRHATPDSRLLGQSSHYYLLGPASSIIKRPSEMPGIIGEPLFVTNEQDANALRQERVLDAIARAYAEGIRMYFQRLPVS